jgi:hypothetical protein
MSFLFYYLFGHWLFGPNVLFSYSIQEELRIHLTILYKVGRTFFYLYELKWAVKKKILLKNLEILSRRIKFNTKLNLSENLFFQVNDISSVG